MYSALQVGCVGCPLLSSDFLLQVCILWLIPLFMLEELKLEWTTNLYTVCGLGLSGGGVT